MVVLVACVLRGDLGVSPMFSFWCENMGSRAMALSLSVETESVNRSSLVLLSSK